MHKLDKLTIFALAALCLTPAYAGRHSRCIEALNRIAHSAENDFQVSKRDSPRERALALVEHRLAQLTHFTEEEKDKLRNTFVSAKLVTADRMFGGLLAEEPKNATDWPEMRIVVHLPERYQGTPLDYSIRLHEFEHCIQTVEMAKRLGSFVTKSILQRRAMENGAMSIEATYLRSFSAKQIGKLISQVKQDEQLSRLDRWFFLLCLENAHLPTKQYLNTHHWRGRYSFFNCAMVVRPALTVVVSVVLLEETLRAAVCRAMSKQAIPDLYGLGCGDGATSASEQNAIAPGTLNEEELTKKARQVAEILDEPDPQVREKKLRQLMDTLLDEERPEPTR